MHLIEVEGHNKLKKIEHGAFFGCEFLRRVANKKLKRALSVTAGP
jgi:hypothetical protein